MNVLRRKKKERKSINEDENVYQVTPSIMFCYNVM